MYLEGRTSASRLVSIPHLLEISHPRPRAFDIVLKHGFKLDEQWPQDVVSRRNTDTEPQKVIKDSCAAS